MGPKRQRISGVGPYLLEESSIPSNHGEYSDKPFSHENPVGFVLADEDSGQREEKEELDADGANTSRHTSSSRYQLQFASKDHHRDVADSLAANLPVKKRKITVRSESNENDFYDDDSDSDGSELQDRRRGGDAEGDAHLEHPLMSKGSTVSCAVSVPYSPARFDQDYSAPVADPYGSNYQSRIDMGRPNMIETAKCNMHEHRWERMFELLLQAETSFGSCKVPLSYEVTTADGSVLKLGLWLGTQRQLYRKGQLRKDKLERLQALVDAGKMDWGEVKSVSDNTRWLEMYEYLLRFYEANGHCNVPERYTMAVQNSPPVKLGRWLDRQRGFMKRGKLRQDRLQKLQSLVEQGVLIQDALQEDEKKWGWCYDALVAYGNEHGDCNVPHAYVIKLPNGSMAKLGVWLSTQRHNQKRPGKLRPDRYRKLQDLVDRNLLKWGDVQISKDQKWELCYAALLQYDLQHGTIDVSRLHDMSLADGTRVKLHKWFLKQIASYRENKLRPDRLARLQELANAGKFTWDSTPPLGLSISDQQLSWNEQGLDSHSPVLPSRGMSLRDNNVQSIRLMRGYDDEEGVMVGREMSNGIIRGSSSSVKQDSESDSSSDSEMEDLDEYQVDALLNVANEHPVA